MLAGIGQTDNVGGEKRGTCSKTLFVSRRISAPSTPIFISSDKYCTACSRADPPTQCSSHQYMLSHSLSEKLGLKSAPSADSAVLKSFLLVGTN